MAKLIFLSGSVRKDSLNKKLVAQAYEFAKELGTDAKLIDLNNYEMPFYDGDLEAASGLPENAKKLKKEFVECDGFFIASPEYNSSFSPLLKNALDWISRPSEKGEAGLIAYRGKVAALSAASPGGFGGLRGLVPLRMMFSNIGVHVLPDQVAISQAHNAFDENGKFKDEITASIIKGLVKSLNDVAGKLK
ncbi:MAG: NAD(P)H-dependent oxidoreductase [Legionellales bacterium]|nr:NAD(P)H-dependent oxidoreductase [Legionellales bacterium]